MTQRRFLALALLATVAWTGSVGAVQYYFDMWEPTADGSMDMHPSEGYSISSDGNYRFTKVYHHITFMGFNGPSDGVDKIPPANPGDTDDGVMLADWLVGKKAFDAVVYFRDATNQSCDPTAATAVYLNDPVTIMGFRCANVGQFVDRGVLGTGHAGCCADYTNALLDGGENAPPAWRMGAPAATGNKYTRTGDIGPGGEYYLMSTKDSMYAGKKVNVTGDADALPASSGFRVATGGTGYQGFSDQANRFAFCWMVEHSDAVLTNQDGAASGKINPADCSGGDTFGGEEPRDLGGDLVFGQGWWAKKLDRYLINALATDVETKGLIFQSIAVALYGNTSVFGRDQGGGTYGPYIAIRGTLSGDCNNDGCVNAADLLVLSSTFGKTKVSVGFNSEADLNLDATCNVVDLLWIASQFGGACL